MADVLEILASDLSWILANGEKTFTTEDGVPDGAEVIDVWCFDGIVHLKLDRDIDE